MPKTDDPQFIIYNQDLTDIISIFWEFHKLRLESGEIPFATRSRKGAANREFDMEQEVRYQRSTTRDDPHPVIEYFADSVNSSVSTSWHKFYHDVNSQQVIIPDQDFVRNKIAEASDLGSEITKTEWVNYYSLEGIMSGGIATATRSLSQLAAVSLAVPSIHPSRTGLVLSKTDVQYSALMERDLGYTNELDVGSSLPELEAHLQELKERIGEMTIGKISGFDLISPTGKDGLNEQKLREYGFPSNGCPAGLKPSQDSKQYLQEHFGIDEYNENVISELGNMIFENFDKYVGNWFRSLSERRRNRIIEPVDLDLLEGRMPSRLKLLRRDLKDLQSILLSVHNNAEGYAEANNYERRIVRQYQPG